MLFFARFAPVPAIRPRCPRFASGALDAPLAWFAPPALNNFRHPCKQPWLSLTFITVGWCNQVTMIEPHFQFKLTLRNGRSGHTPFMTFGIFGEYTKHEEITSNASGRKVRAFWYLKKKKNPKKRYSYYSWTSWPDLHRGQRVHGPGPCRGPFWK